MNAAHLKVLGNDARQCLCRSLLPWLLAQPRFLRQCWHSFAAANCLVKSLCSTDNHRKLRPLAVPLAVPRSSKNWCQNGFSPGGDKKPTNSWPRSNTDLVSLVEANLASMIQRMPAQQISRLQPFVLTSRTPFKGLGPPCAGWLTFIFLRLLRS